MAYMTPPPVADVVRPRGRYVRRAVKRYSPYLGSLRYVEGRRAPWWIPFVLTIMLIPVAPLHRRFRLRYLESWPASVGFVLILLTVLMLIVGTRRCLVFDHGLVSGWFLPWSRQYAFSWTQVDLSSIRSFIGTNKLDRMVGSKAIEDNGLKYMVWIDAVVTLVGPSREAARRWPDAMDSLFDPMPPVEGRQLWLLGVKENPENLVHAIVSAMVNVGVPDAWHIPRMALPPQKLSGRSEDYAQIPGNRGKGL